MNVLADSIFCYAEVHYSRPLFLRDPCLCGEDVRMLQKSLCFRGYWLPQDGVFGSVTYNMLRRFQSSSGLKSDGIFGINTRGKLCRYL